MTRGKNKLLLVILEMRMMFSSGGERLSSEMGSNSALNKISEDIQQHKSQTQPGGGRSGL